MLNVILLALIFSLVTLFVRRANVKYKSVSKDNISPIIIKNTGEKSLILLDCGENKATVIATLRQITGIDLAAANIATSNLPSILISQVSEQEAELSKQALEFVGATLEIK